MKHVAILLFFSTLLFACKKEQPALRSLEEDCGCAKEVSADFVMEESTYFNTSWEKLTETDTIFMNKNVQFRALENNAEYTWYLGSEGLHEQTFYRYFDQNLANQDIKVTLVVRKKPNLICKPHDDGYDSIIKYLHVSNKDSDSAFVNPYPMLEGVFRMKEKDGVDSIDIVIELHNDIVQGGTLRIYNYDGQGSNSPLNYYGGFEGMNYRQFWYAHNLRDNMIHHRLDGVVELNMISTAITPVKSYYYLGRKIQ